MKRSRAGRVGLFLVVIFGLSACAGTFSSVTPGQVQSPRSATAPTTLVIRELGVGDATWERYRPDFAKGVRDWLTEHSRRLTVVSDTPASTPPPESIVLVGSLTEVTKGNAALRFLVGMGAGQAKAKGDFVLERPAGGVLAKFTARRSYLGGAGIGGAGFLDMEELVTRLGWTVAETIDKWLRGESLE